jgi:LysM repeat protein
MLSKKLIAILMLTGAFLAVLPLSGVFAASGVADIQSQSAAPQESLGPNLLTNGGMDGKYVKQCSLRNGPQWVQVPCPENYAAEAGTIKQWETTQVPFGWSAWWQQPNQNFDDPNYFNTYPHYCPDWSNTPLDCKAWHNPEYRDTLGGPQKTGPSRKVAGDNSQKYFTFYSVHEAGVYQVVSGVKPGDRVRFSVFQEGWSNSVNDPFKSDLGQRMNFQVGIDPTGGNNPWSPNIIWTAPAESFDKFTQFVVEAVAKNNIVSVWTKSKPDLPLQHVDVYVDEASLNVVQPAKAKAPAKTTRVITTTKVITNSNGITSTVVTTRTVAVTPVPAMRVITTTKIITTTRQITGTDGIVYTALITQSVIVTKTTPVSTTKPVTPTKPVTSTTSVTGTLPIPASGAYTVVKGDSLSKIARRFGITLATLLALNKDVIKDPNRIEAGMVLKLK